MAELLPAFRSVAQCAKCGTWRAYGEHYEAESTDVLGRVYAERMRVVCRNCGYTWHERCQEADR